MIVEGGTNLIGRALLIRLDARGADKLLFDDSCQQPQIRSFEELFPRQVRIQSYIRCVTSGLA
jgi:hypothetical protein